MVNHIVTWKLKEELSAEEKAAAKSRIKEGLEGLVGVVPGLLSAKVETELLDSSTGDFALFTTLESEEALKAYAVNPDHLKVAEYVRSVVCQRAAIDY